MKDFRGMKRQRSRNRKPSGNQNNPNRAYESNGPEGTKVRGNAQTIYEKYQQLARDANSSGDRVLAENHLQHAEHYFRLIRQMQPQRPVSEFVQRDPFSNGFDEYDEEFDGEATAETDGETAVSSDEPQPGFDDNNGNGGNNGGNGRPRFEQRDRNGNGNGNGNRDNNRDRDRNGNRDNNRNRDQQPRSFEPRNNEPRSSEPPRANFSDEGEFDANGGRRESRRERYERRRAQRLTEQEQIPGVVAANGSPSYIASTEPLGASNGRGPGAPSQPDLAFEPPATPQPVIRERPVREKPQKASAANGDDTASHLPAFLSRPTPVAAAPAEAVADDAAAKPKRGRPKRKIEEATEEA